jgi:hypothetical protein
MIWGINRNILVGGAMAYDKECPFCNPLKDEEQNIVFENKTCYFLQHNLQQDVLEGSGVIVPK